MAVGLAFLCHCVGLLLQFSSAQTNDEILVELVKQLGEMQIKINKLERSEQMLKESVSALIGTNAQFRLQIEELANGLQECKTSVSDKGLKLDMLEKTLFEYVKDTENAEKENCKIDEGKEKQYENIGKNLELNELDTKTILERHDEEGEVYSKDKRNNEGEIRQSSERIVSRQVPEKVAFAVYLDHVLRGLGKDQPVVYNQVLLNDQSAYDAATGIFTAPVAGVYLFSWSVTARKLPGEHSYDVWVKLLVNGDHKLGAVAESRADTDDNQGSNTLVLRLNRGDRVWTAHYSAYPDLFGDDNERTTSFMGVILYVEE